MKTAPPSRRHYAVKTRVARLFGVNIWKRAVILEADSPSDAIRLAVVRRDIKPGKPAIAKLAHIKP